MKYTTLLFDADGTLYDFDKAETTALTNFYQARNIPCSFEKFRKVYERENGLLWKALERGEISPGRIKVDRFVNTMENLGIYEGNGEELSVHFMNELAACPFLLPGAEELISKLDGLYDLYIITNGLWDVQKIRVGRSDIYLNYFKGMVVSEKVGSSKPDRGIFEEVRRMAGNPPLEKMLIIGDSLTSDVRGGDLFGIDTCWYNPEKSELTGPSEPTYEVSDFDSLADLLV